MPTYARVEREQRGGEEAKEERSRGSGAECSASLLAIAESNDKIGRLLLSDAATIHPRRRG